MGKKTTIEWCDHTWNPWWGCQRVSPGCEHCYAETFAKRVGQQVWGPAKTTSRRLFGDKHWAEPLAWDRKAYKDGVRRRVFCASMADVFEEHPDLGEPRARLFEMIHQTRHLDWQLLTKRPENVASMVPRAWWRDGFPENVWLGTSVEDQRRADERIPLLLSLAAKVRFLSCEPLLGPVDVRQALTYRRRPGEDFGSGGNYLADLHGIDWVIVGGETGPGARPCGTGWIRSLVGQCRDAGTACFVKQLGAQPISPDGNPFGWDRGFDAKGGDPDDWPNDLRVRQFPDSTVGL